MRYVADIDQFQDTVGSLIELVLAASESVETQKLKVKQFFLITCAWFVKLLILHQPIGDWVQE